MSTVVVIRKSSALGPTEGLFGAILFEAGGMTPDEISIAEALYGCSFCPGSSQKRFVRQMAERDRSKSLSERQRAYLWAIAWSWRRQLPRALVEMAWEYTGGVGIRGRQINDAGRKNG